MSVPRILAIVGCIGLAGIGCSRKHTRTDPLQRHPPVPTATIPSETAQQPFTPPTPPAPPPLPTPEVAPPRSDVLAVGVPPMPSAATPTTLDVATNPAASPASPVAPTVAPPPQLLKQEPVTVQPPPPISTPTATPATSIIPTAAATPALPSSQSDAAVVRKLLEQSQSRWATVIDYDARLVKREVVKGKKMPQDEIQYRFRKQPLSVGMRVVSEEGQGRELVYVQGRDDNGMHVIVGKGDSALARPGFKTTVRPDSAQATAKSRYKIYEAGFGRTLTGLAKAVTAAEGGARIVKPLGPQERPEYPYPLEAVEVTIRSGDDPLFPRGGKRVIYFDPKPDSPSLWMPVLTIASDHTGTEVEYYCFDRIRLPAGLSDVDFDPARMGNRK